MSLTVSDFPKDREEMSDYFTNIHDRNRLNLLYFVGLNN